jgi:hypothetical protein
VVVKMFDKMSIMEYSPMLNQLDPTIQIKEQN